MNIFRCKKVIVLASIFMILMVLASQSLSAAKERRGRTVEVTMTDGSQVKGELLAVKADALLVYDSDAGQGKSIDLQQVVQVKLSKKSKFLQGMGIGLVAGVGLGALINATLSAQGQEYAALTFIYVLPITSLCGGILGSIAGRTKRFSLATSSSQNVQHDLERLKRYAREQDFEKPGEPH